jgi:hypothetical protein
LENFTWKNPRGDAAARSDDAVAPQRGTFRGAAAKGLGGRWRDRGTVVRGG